MNSFLETLSDTILPTPTRIAIAEDNNLFRKTLAKFLTCTGRLEVVIEASNGQDVLNQLNKCELLPDIVLMDFRMPVLDGKNAAKLIKNKYPAIKVIILTLYHHEHLIIEFLRLGVSGFLSKNIDSDELLLAIATINRSDFYVESTLKDRLPCEVKVELTAPRKNADGNIFLTEQQKKFIQLASTSYCYKEIAVEMQISPRTVDDYRDRLFRKLNIGTRVEMVLYGIRNGLIDLE